MLVFRFTTLMPQQQFEVNPFPLDQISRDISQTSLFFDAGKTITTILLSNTVRYEERPLLNFSTKGMGVFEFDILRLGKWNGIEWKMELMDLEITSSLSVVTH